MIAAPITKNGESRGCILYAIDPIIFSEYLAEIKVGANGSSFIVDNKDTIIAHPNTDYVYDAYNPITASATDVSAQGLANSVQNLIDGNSGFDGSFHH